MSAILEDRSAVIQARPEAQIHAIELSTTNGPLDPYNSAGSIANYQPSAAVKKILNDHAGDIDQRYAALEGTLKSELLLASQRADQLRAVAKTDSELSLAKVAYQDLLTQGEFFLGVREHGAAFLAISDLENSHDQATLIKVAGWLKGSSNPHVQECLYQKIISPSSSQALVNACADSLIGCKSPEILAKLSAGAIINSADKLQAPYGCLRALTGVEDSAIQMMICKRAEERLAVEPWEDLRVQVARTLQGTRCPETITYLVDSALNSHISSMRAFACRALAGNPDPQIQERICKLYQQRKLPPEACVEGLSTPICPAAYKIVLSIAFKSPLEDARLLALKVLEKNHHPKLDRLLQGGRNFPYHSEIGPLGVSSAFVFAAFGSCFLPGAPELVRSYAGGVMVVAGLAALATWDKLSRLCEQNISYGIKDSSSRVREQCAKMLAGRNLMKQDQAKDR